MSYQHREVEIKQVRLGDIIINLGEVLEIDELPNFFSIVISRLNNKEVLKFAKGTMLVIGKKP